jgi:hypothetical protein
MQTNVFSIVVMYGLLYSMMNPEDFGFKNLIDPYYFSFTTLSSVGYGDFSPKTDLAKVIVMSQQAIMLTQFFQALKRF